MFSRSTKHNFIILASSSDEQQEQEEDEQPMEMTRSRAGMEFHKHMMFKGMETGAAAGVVLGAVRGFVGNPTLPKMHFIGSYGWKGSVAMAAGMGLLSYYIVEIRDKDNEQKIIDRGISLSQNKPQARMDLMAAGGLISGFMLYAGASRGGPVINGLTSSGAASIGIVLASIAFLITEKLELFDDRV